MNLSIIGLGYVGYTMAACLSNNNKIFCVDIDINKINLLSKGQSTIFEPNIDELIKKGVDKSNILATTNLKEAILNSDISFLTIGTPGKDDGTLDTSQIFNACKEIGTYIKLKNDFHTIVIRSTTPPKTNEKITKIIEETSGKIKDKDFAVVTNPEFLREGSAINDFYNPELILIGTTSNIAKNKLKELFSDINGEFIFTDIEVAEIMKFVSNSFHALKVCFANEIGNVCKSQNIDGNKVMEILCKDKKLNISPYYLKPGFAFGGSCLSKDLNALNALSNENDVISPILNSIEDSNKQHIEYGVKLIESFHLKNIGFLGLTFKSDTDDLRFSPFLEVIKKLINKSYNISVYDEILKEKQNYQNINNILPNNSLSFKNDVSGLIQSCEIVVISNRNKKYDYLYNEYPSKIFIDLCGQYKDKNRSNIFSLSK